MIKKSTADRKTRDCNQERNELTSENVLASSLGAKLTVNVTQFLLMSTDQPSPALEPVALRHCTLPALGN